jgi:hypothetical protein
MDFLAEQICVSSVHPAQYSRVYVSKSIKKLRGMDVDRRYAICIYVSRCY